MQQRLAIFEDAHAAFEEVAEVMVTGVLHKRRVDHLRGRHHDADVDAAAYCFL